MTLNPHVEENLIAIEKALSNYDTSFLSDDEEDLCPLCLEPLDVTDKNFKPCPCGYQICQFCYNNIRQNEELNGKCPACRRKYDDENVEYIVLSPEQIKLEREKQAKKDWERKQRDKERKENEYANRKHLAGMRVIQKNLVYIIGINPPVPYEEVAALLKSDKYFGQYGRITKIVINKKSDHHQTNTTTTGYGVYITFARKEDATKCITQVDGTYIDGRMIKAAYGTTKYCSSYLRGLPCPNPNCMFLHEPGEEADSFNRRELTANKSQPTHFKTGTPSPANVKTSLHHDNTASVLTPAAPHTNPWGITQSSTPVNTISLSKNQSSSHLPTLADARNQTQATATSTSASSSSTNHTSSKLKKNDKEDHIDPYDPSNSAIRFLNEKLQFLSDYESKPIHLNTNIVEDDIYKKFPPLFSWKNIETTTQSDGILTKKLIDTLTIKPVEPLDTVHAFLQPQHRPLQLNTPPPPGIFTQQPQQQPQQQPNSTDFLNRLINGKRVSVGN